MNQKVLRRIKRRDRAARHVITIGGLAIIASVILILFLIVEVALPLFRDPQAELIGRYTPAAPATAADALAVGVDEYLQTGLLIDRGGEIRFFDPRSEQPVGRLPITPPDSAKHLLQAEPQGHLSYSLLWDDGSVTVDRVRFRPVFDAAGQRSFTRDLERLAAFPPPEGGIPERALARAGDSGQMRVALLADGRVEVAQEVVSTDFLGNEKAENHTFVLAEAAPEKILSLALNHDGTSLYAGTDRGNAAALGSLRGRQPGTGGKDRGLCRSAGDHRPGAGARGYFPGGRAMSGAACPPGFRCAATTARSAAADPSPDSHTAARWRKSCRRSATNRCSAATCKGCCIWIT